MHVVLECGIEFSRVSGVSSKFVVNMQLFFLSCCASECNDIFWNPQLCELAALDLANSVYWSVVSLLGPRSSLYSLNVLSHIGSQ